MHKKKYLCYIVTLIILILPLKIFSGEYYVKRGDNAYRIAKKFGVSLSELKKLNPILNLSRLVIGQKVIVPDRQEQNTENAVTVQEPLIPLIKPVKPSGSHSLSEKIFKFSILYTMNGGTVVCAAGGNVTYAGDIDHLGKVIFIDHGNGFITVYKIFNSDIKVRKGELVQTGQVIASGNNTMKLYFHFFKGNQPINPVRCFR